MKAYSHYKEEDFQNYFDNHFTGDRAQLENHLLDCERCSKNFQAYASVWSFTKKELKTEPLSIDLAYVVANRVFAAREIKPVYETIFYGILIGLAIACLYLCISNLIFNSMPIPFLLLIIPLGLYLLLSYKEIKMVNQKFAVDQ